MENRRPVESALWTVLTSVRSTKSPLLVLMSVPVPLLVTWGDPLPGDGGPVQHPNGRIAQALYVAVGCVADVLHDAMTWLGLLPQSRPSSDYKVSRTTSVVSTAPMLSIPSA